MSRTNRVELPATAGVPPMLTEVFTQRTWGIMHDP
jgi:hypothetical protein